LVAAVGVEAACVPAAGALVAWVAAVGFGGLVGGAAGGVVGAEPGIAEG
jgi:hypothetical protein